MCSSVDYWRCRWIKLGGALEYPQRGPSDPHLEPDLSTVCPQGYPQGWRADPQGWRGGTRRCGGARASPRRRRGHRRAGPTGRSASRSPCGRAGPAPPLRLRLTAALPRHRSPRAVPSARSPWARSPVRHPLAPGRAVRSKPWGSIRGGRESQGRRPRLRPIRAPVPTGVLGWWTSSECYCGPGSGRSRRASRLNADARGWVRRLGRGQLGGGLPAQRGRGRFGGRRCTRGRRHTRPVRPVRLGAGAGGSVAERPDHSKRWPARIFHPPRPALLPSRSGAMTPFPGRAGAAAHPKDTRRPPFSAPPTPRAATAGPPEASTAPGPSSTPARTATAGVASRSPRGNHRTAPGPARISRIRPARPRP